MNKSQWMNEFSSNLRSLMHEANLTPTEVAHKARISPSAISRYLLGERMPTIKAVTNLSHVFDCDLLDLADFGEMID